eukprot:gnl/MRDRNA2_/MRDRNA2_121887_c0_seq1.p1 gnl/MRDRNA2_/MRDRNA2_121887_c0~~gnl/MRDRNA2_/MRDRNA2_121887_c0_seq1.p1  ORF type:complete len:582 (-),score=82.08 gnl/MRDRNA2_/MRDRNA2_121887_c0_seq1:221-1966(-)
MASNSVEFPSLSPEQGVSLAVVLDALGPETDVERALQLLETYGWDLEATLFAARGPDDDDEFACNEHSRKGELDAPLHTAASVAMIDLITEVKADKSKSVLTKAVRAKGHQPVEAIVCGHVVRNVVSQGPHVVCAAAAVAGAINACYERIPEMQQRLEWPIILYEHFRDALGIKVVVPGKDGRMIASTRHVGNNHVLQVLRSFPHIGAVELIGRTLAGNPNQAWGVLLETLKHSEGKAVLFHSTNHYSLIHGCVGGQEYDENSCAIFASSLGQEAFELIPFKKALRTITRCRFNTYRMFVVQHTGCERIVDTHKELSSEADGEESPPELDCAVCLDLLCEPIQLPCAHTFCRNCLLRISQRKCPLCRAPHPDGFDPFKATADCQIEELLRRNCPDYLQRVQHATAERSRMLNLIVGNRHQLVSNPKRSKSGNLNKHKWTMFVELQQSSVGINDMIEKVNFKLAPYYTAWPSTDHHSVRVGKNPEVRSAPFEVTRIGWGYFPVTINITWKSWLKVPPTLLEHELCFDNSGSSSTHKVDLGDALAGALNPAGMQDRSQSLGRAAGSSSRSTSRAGSLTHRWRP